MHTAEPCVTNMMMMMMVMKRRRKRRRASSSCWILVHHDCPALWVSAPLSVVGLLPVVGVHGVFLEALALLHHFAATGQEV